jgi:hypothetical protein
VQEPAIGIHAWLLLGLQLHEIAISTLFLQVVDVRNTHQPYSKTKWIRDTHFSSFLFLD